MGETFAFPQGESVWRLASVRSMVFQRDLQRLYVLGELTYPFSSFNRRLALISYQYGHDQKPVFESFSIVEFVDINTVAIADLGMSRLIAMASLTSRRDGHLRVSLYRYPYLRGVQPHEQWLIAPNRYNLVLNGGNPLTVNMFGVRQGDTDYVTVAIQGSQVVHTFEITEDLVEQLAEFEKPPVESFQLQLNGPVSHCHYSATLNQVSFLLNGAQSCVEIYEVRDHSFAHRLTIDLHPHLDVINLVPRQCALMNTGICAVMCDVLQVGQQPTTELRFFPIDNSNRQLEYHDRGRDRTLPVRLRTTSIANDLCLIHPIGTEILKDELLMCTGIAGYVDFDRFCQTIDENRQFLSRHCAYVDQ